MTSHLSAADLARMRRGGVGALTDGQGLELFDAAVGADRPQALAVPLDHAALRAAASAGALPPLFAGLIQAPRRRSAGSAQLAAKLATLPEHEREDFTLDFVRGHVAAVLGHDSTTAVDADRAFKDFGFDSLAAVELRNRLSAQAGMRLAATIVFDYPSASALARHLLDKADVSTSPVGGAEAQIAELESVLSVSSLDDSDRADLAERLRALAEDLEDSDRGAPVASERDRLESASDDELLDALDKMAGKA